MVNAYMRMTGKTVITGIGILSPIGIGKDTYWDSLLHGKSGFSPIRIFDTSPFTVHTAGEISDFDPVSLLGKKGIRTLDRSTRLISAAAGLAIDDAKLRIDDGNSHSVGVSVGTTFGSLHSISQFDRDGLVEGPKYVNPSHFPNTVINSPASQVSIRFGIKGFNTTISTGSCAGLDAVSYASDFIRLGRAEVVLAGGVEELCEETFRGFYQLGCLSGMDGSEPVCRPFDAGRNGTILSEGAAVLVLENEQHALGRSAGILATVSGYGNSFDPSAGNAFDNSGKGLRNAIGIALEDAVLTPEDIDYVASGANATKRLDRLETGVLKEVFGEAAFRVPVSAIKSMVGESFSASGALALSASVGAIVRSTLPPTMNYAAKDPACDLDYVPNVARPSPIKNVLVLSSDLYGNNTAMVLSRYE
jgi:3-oxoacyl-[acyl-carrier-protein] synthase II